MRVFLIVLTAIILTAGIVGCGNDETSQKETTEIETPEITDDKESPITVEKEQYTLRLGHIAPVEHNYHIWSEKFKELVEERSDGNLTIEIYPSEILGTKDEMIVEAQKGTVDLVLTSDSTLSSYVEEVGVLNLPFLFEDFDEVFDVVNGNVGNILEEKIAAKNLIVIGWWENGFKHFTNSKRPIVEPEDLEGLKIRTSSSQVFIDTMNELGASAVAIEFGELYSSLQSGIVDGQSNPTTHIYHLQLYEIQDYLSLSGHFHVVEPLLMSKSVFENIGEEYQNILLQAGEEVSRIAFYMKRKNFEEELQLIKDTGMQVNEVNREAFVEAVQPIYDKYEDVYGKDLIDFLMD